MILSLTSPVGSDFIKDFPAVNEINCDLIDAFAGPCLTTHALTAWTPQLTGSTANPSLGNGSIKGYYYRIFDQIYIWAEFRFGSGGGTFGTGTFIVSIPFPAKGNMGFYGGSIGEAPPIGVGSIWDDNSDAGKQMLSVHLRTANTLMFGVKIGGVTSRELTDSVPLTWDVSDGITFSARYTRDA